MNFHILTLFPEMVMQGLNTSIIGRACEKGLLSINAVNIRDFTTDKHKKVDDYPYGGGAGMLMQAQPVYDAYLHVVNHMKTRQRPRVVYVTPQGKVFNQKKAIELSKKDHIEDRACSLVTPDGEAVDFCFEAKKGCTLRYHSPKLWSAEEPNLYQLTVTLTNGMGQGLFGANGPCNRAQIVTFLYRTFAV